MRQGVRALRLRSLAAACLLPAGMAWSPAQADGPGGPGPGEITLDIRNDTGVPIRCVVVLAHFVTRDVEAIAPGASRTLVLARDPAAGTLAYGEHAGQPMHVENILCGSATDWEAAHADMALARPRTTGAVRYKAVCSGDVAFACEVVEAIFGD